MKKIAIIGMGHMGKALQEGLLANGFSKEQILTSHNVEDNKKVASRADWIVIAVKPTVVSQVIEQITDCLANKLLISVASGVTLSAFEKYITDKKQKVIRLMPNLPVAYGQGVIGLYANKNISLAEKKEISMQLSCLGMVIDCQKEEDLDAITLLAGSGSGLVAYFISLFSKSGHAFGFEKDQAEEIALQTFIGTLSVLKNTKESAQQLQNAVATKGGVTEAIIASLDKEKIAERFSKSLALGYAKIKKITKDLAL